MLTLVSLAVTSMMFDCKLEPALALHRDKNAVTANSIAFPDAAGPWPFGLKLKGDSAEVIWPDSPMQVSGKSLVVPTAENAGMFVSVAGGPCLFTESACGTLIQYAEQKDGTLKILLTPAALATDRDANTREPFLVMLNGACSPEGAKP